MLKKISIIVAAFMTVMSVNVSAAKNPYNEMDAINLSNKTIDDYAASMGVTVEEFKLKHGLPADMPGDTNEAIAFGYVPVKIMAEEAGTSIEEAIAQYKQACVGFDNITGDTLMKDIKTHLSLKTMYGSNEAINEVKNYYGLSDNINENSLYGEVATQIERAELANAGLLSYDDGDEILVMVKGKYLDFDVAPAIEDNRVLVPMRNIFTALGAEVYWQQDVQTIIAVRGDDVIAMQLGQNYLFKNNEKIEIPTAPIARDGRTLVPVRAVAEALDTEVYYNGNTKTVVIH